MSISLKAAMGVAALMVATQAAAQVTLYSRDGFRGEQFTVNGVARNLDRVGFNDAASSVVVTNGSWEVCQDAGFNGRCAILRPGEYPTLASMGLDDEISSVRPVEEQYGSAAPGYYAERSRERLYEAPVVAVHAVVGPAEQRCWIERRDFVGNPNVPGAIAGAVIGGIIGHQIGSGRGNDVATAGGAVAGAAIGANVGRDDYGHDVQRCANVTRYDHPAYWDVTYDFRGAEHHVAMASPPGSTITVDADGQPRV